MLKQTLASLVSKKCEQATQAVTVSSDAEISPYKEWFGKPQATKKK